MRKDVFLEEAVLDDLAKDLDLLELPLSEKAFKLVGAAMAAIILTTTAILFFIGGIKSDFYKNRALVNSSKIIPLPAERGLVFDRFNGALVENQPIFRISLRLPELLKKNEKEKTLLRLEKILEIDPEEIQKLISDADLESQDSINLSVELSEEQAAELENLNLRPVQIKRDFKREYFESKIFSHILGYVGSVDKNDLKENPNFSINDIIGRSGLESYYDGQLRGKDGKIIYRRNAKGEIIGDESLYVSQPGQLLYTTIDAEFQKYFYTRLNKRLGEIGSRQGVGLALNPQNGEVLALVSLPSFDANEITSKTLSDSGKPLFNRAISGLYVPGSTIKPLVALAALKEKIVSAKDRIFSRGYIEIPNPYEPDKPTRYPDWKPHGWVNLYSALAVSSNVYFYAVGGGLPPNELNSIVSCGDENCFKGLGIERLKIYWQQFGLNKKTGIDLSYEASGVLPDVQAGVKNKDIWRIGDTYNVSIGQGDLMATPLEILNYIAVIANNGVSYKPFVVKKIISSKEEAVYENQPQIANDLSKDFADYLGEVKKGMIDTVAKPYGTAYLLSDLPVKVAAKTGTAQIKQNTKINAFFAGFAPADNPQIAVLVLIEEAKEGSSNALPVAKEVLKWYYENRLK